MAEDTVQMQQEAARRVRRMQEHSRRVFEAHQGRTAESLAAARPPAPPLYARPQPPAEPPSCRGQQLPCEPAPQPPSPPEKAGLLAGLPFDTEQLMLLGLALLLFRSGCRPELAVALLYLAM